MSFPTLLVQGWRSPAFTWHGQAHSFPSLAPEDGAHSRGLPPGQRRGPRTGTPSLEVCPVCAALNPLFRARGLGVTLELPSVLSFIFTHPMAFAEHLLSAQCHVLRRLFEYVLYLQAD